MQKTKQKEQCKNLTACARGSEVKGTQQGRGSQKLLDEVFGHLLRAAPPGRLVTHFPSAFGVSRINLTATRTQGLETDRRGSYWARPVPPEASKGRILSALYRVTKSFSSPEELSVGFS